MTTGNLESPGVGAPIQPAKTNVFSRIAGVLFSPAETFQDIARRPDILAPMILLVIIGYLNTVVLMPRMDFDAAARAQLQQSGREMTESELEQGTRMTAGVMKTFGWIGPILGILIWLIVAGVLLLAFRIFGGEGNYKQALSAYMYAAVPMTIYAIVLAIVTYARGTIDPLTVQTVVKSNPGFLVDPLQQRVLYAILTSIDVFIVWTLALLTFGYSALSRLSRTKAAVIIVSLWLITVLVKVGLAAMTAARG